MCPHPDPLPEALDAHSFRARLVDALYFKGTAKEYSPMEQPTFFIGLLRTSALFLSRQIDRGRLTTCGSPAAAAYPSFQISPFAARPQGVRWTRLLGRGVLWSATSLLNK